jgi:phospholipid/cholesterol/gamma-HCH transport system substrate-binding protein
MPRRTVSRKQARSFLAGIGVLAVVGVVSYVALTAGQGGLPLQPHTDVQAAFANVGTLGTGEDVREDSVRVGRVTSIRYTPAAAVVTLQLSSGSKVYRNARAAIWDLSALGQKFVELLPGDRSAGPLDGRTIPVSQTESSADIDQLFNVFDPRTRSALASTAQQLGGGAAGYSQQLHDFLAAAPDLLGDTGTVTTALASSQANLPALLASAQQLSAQLRARAPEIGSLLRQTNATLQAVNVDGDKPLGETLSVLPPTLQKAQAALDALNQPLNDLQQAMTTLQPGAQALGIATPDLRDVLNDAPVPLGKVPGVARTAQPAVEVLTKTFSEAQPLAPRLDETLASLRELLDGLGPYSMDLAEFLQNGTSMVNDGQGYTHYVRLSIGPVDLGHILGVVKIPSDPNPAPGQASNDRSNPGIALIPGGAQK